MNGIVFFDYDGTLADTAEGITAPTPSTVQALAALRQNGYLPVLCTGRSHCYLPSGAEQLFDTVITANGAGAWKKGKPLWRETFTVPQLRGLEAFLTGCGAASFYETDEGGYSADLASPLLQEVMKAMAFSAGAFRPLHPAGLSMLPVCKCVAFFDNATALSTLCTTLGGQYEIRAGKGGRYADINQKNMHKGVGAARLTRLFGIAPACTYAFGDGENDLELLQTAGTGIAMGHHAPGLEQAAAFVTGTVAQEGVAQGLIRLGLIPG